MNKTITIGQDTDHPLTVNRLGYGTMRLPGELVWGEPANRSNALDVIRTAAASGVQFFDTAGYYGPGVTNPLLVDALYPYAKDIVICTKVGATRAADKSWPSFTTPANLRQAIDEDLKSLKTDRLQVVHFRMSAYHNPVPFAESMEAMFELQKEGKILHLGLSNITRDELLYGLSKGKIATVQNQYSASSRTTYRNSYTELRGGDEVLDICEAEKIVFTPFFTLINSLEAENDSMTQIAAKYGITKAQANLAWLLHKSPCMLPIPGTSSVAHLLENLKSATIEFSAEDWKLLE